ncbi:MAG TPA: C25 family cysteine peptidase, partial [Bacteroidales bacterium]|nr:C25 family cysteine peptidase [Bacteroidales bacterium]
MKKILFFLVIAIISMSARAQYAKVENPVIRSVQDRGVKGVDISYLFNEVRDYTLFEQQTEFARLSVKDFTFLKEVGKPALPAHYDIVLIPEGAVAGVVLKNAPYLRRDNLLIYPALRPATDRYGDPEPAFEIDSAFYQSKQWYPENPVSIVNIIKVKGVSLAIVQVCPVQYNPQLRQAKVYGALDYEVSFSKSNSLISQKELYSPAFLTTLQNIVLNSYSLKAEISAVSTAKNSFVQEKAAGAKNYIIITHSDYRAAADSLAKWKSQLGYSVEIVSRSNWTSTLVKTEVHNRYQSWIPKPDYFVIIGDHDKVPGEIHQDPSYGDNFATDLYYACMDGSNDYVADMAFGRISVSSAAEALTVVNKIISYEKNPPVQPNFYTKASVCGYFQDDDPDTYEDRRFLLTSEEIRNYMVAQGFTVNRIYDAGASVNPSYYNDGYYANSEPLPPALLRANGFGWNGTKDTIAASINSADGRLFITHRDHGYTGGTGWASPQFTSTHIDLLNNGNRLPVVFSINCHTGEYQLQECFAEKFLRKANGGAVGVFGAAYFSWSGNNDGLIDGMIDAIWATPGLIPPFTGNGDSPVGSPVAHQPIYTMGDVLNQGLMRMIQTWGDDDYTHELFHYFGDPAMKIWTSFPNNITATHQNALDCHDTTFTINSSSCNHCLATLVVDGELIASDSLNSAPLTLHFPPVLGSSAVLTISRHNYKPYVATIPFISACLRPGFDIFYDNACVGQTVSITDASSGTILAYLWDFGAGATPATGSNAGPFQVVYNTPGMKFITLAITGASGTETLIDSVYIDQPCVYNTTQNQHVIINACQGILYDNGGLQDYMPNSNDTITIAVPGASSINLHFADFDIEQGDNGTCNYDNLQIFNGNG